HALREHGLENQVHEKERTPEVNLAPKLTHHPAGKFREPVIHTGEKSENCAGRNDVMEMGDYVIGVMEVNVAIAEAQWKPRQTTDAEHRQECHDKEHRSVESDGASPERNEHAGENDHRRDGNNHRGGLEKRGDGRAHAREIHVM